MPNRLGCFKTNYFDLSFNSDIIDSEFAYILARLTLTLFSKKYASVFLG